MSLINSLRLAWPPSEETTAYAVNILAQMGHHAPFPKSPNHKQLWSTVIAGKLLGKDTSRWEPDLESETKRLTQLTTEYESQRLELEKQLAEAQARLRQSKAKLAAIQREEVSPTAITD